MAAPLSPTSRQAALARFAVFEADLASGELRKQGRRMRLQDQPFAVLAILLERAGNVVSREELRERLWPADTFVDFDHSLNTAVAKLRDALGDSASSPRFIETLAKRGYRFVADVEWSSPAAASSGTSGNTHSPSGAELDVRFQHRGVSRSLFAAIQVMYTVFYLLALIRWEAIDRTTGLGRGTPIILVSVLVTAAVGIPVRFYLLSATAFDYTRLGEKFNRIFPAIFVLDELWALAPFLIHEWIGFGGALAATAALLYVPFAERTLLRMAYGGALRRSQAEHP
ncbi:MAG: winged helix-turn-helix domain-containing protein [Acidobacteria bacterium]|nr:winged helix-turn-helix domain-containing protein [Acidobacteriota bacterium]